MILDLVKSERDLQCVVPRCPETKDRQGRLFLLLPAVTTGQAHYLVKVRYHATHRSHDGLPTRCDSRTSQNQGTSTIVPADLGDECG